MMEEEMISLSEIFDAVKKRWKLIVSVTLIATIVSALISFFVLTPVYETSTKVFIGKEAGNEEYNYNDITMYQKLLSTYSETIQTRDLVERALASIDCDLTATSVLTGLSVTTITDTQIMKITYSNTDAELAAKVLNAIAEEFIRTSNEMISNGNVQTIESVQVPKDPVSPNKKMNVAIAFVLGLMVSLGIVFLLEYLDNTYKNKEQVEKELGLPVLGSIPFSDEI